jgi:hypothetical protein
MEGTIPTVVGLLEAHNRGLLSVSCVFLIRLCIDLQRLAAVARKSSSELCFLI